MKCTLISTSAFITTAQEIKAKVNCDNMGFEMTHFFRIPHKFLGRWAGTPTERIRQINEAFASDDEIVWNCLGESGIIQIINDIPYKKFKSKTVIGSSDTTLLVNMLAQKRNFPTYFGPNASTKIDTSSMQFLKERIEQKPFDLSCHIMQKGGKEIIKGKLAGGDLLSITWGLGLHGEVNFQNKIAFFNKLGKTNYSTYNNLVQLKNTKAFTPKAIIFLKPPRKNPKKFKRMIKELFPNITIIHGLHSQQKIKKPTIPINWDCTINLKKKQVSVKPAQNKKRRKE